MEKPCKAASREHVPLTCRGWKVGTHTLFPTARSAASIEKRVCVPTFLQCSSSGAESACYSRRSMLTVHPPHPAGDAAPHPGAVWIDIMNPDPGETALVRELTGLQLPPREELGSLEQSSRMTFDHDCLRL